MSSVFEGSLPRGAKCIAVIMAGGSGTRFWPLSRNSRPKQFLPLGQGEGSLIQATARRLRPLCGEEGVMVVTSSSQKDLVREHLPQASILSEPSARNTAACIGLAATKILASIGDVPMLCLPADHSVVGDEAILSVYRKALELARGDCLVTIGVKPTCPDTAFGYIQRGAADAESGAFRVERFVEKPNRAKAEEYLAAGDFFWNSGMFVWRPSVVLAAIAQFLPELGASLSKIEKKFIDFPALQGSDIAEDYNAISSISIDVGILEKAKNVLMLPGEGFAWSDIGSWDAWAEEKAKAVGDSSGNVVQGKAVLVRCADTTVLSAKRLIATVGVSDLIVIDTDDALLICHKSEAQGVREVVEALKREGKTELL